MNHRKSVKATFSFVSLGCPKNLVDSERMLGLLAQDGYVLVPEEQQAPTWSSSTPAGSSTRPGRSRCGVIREMLDRKRAGADQGGHRRRLPGRAAGEMLLEEVPEVDQVVGVFGREEIARVADRIMGGLHEQRTVFRPAPVQAQDDRARLRITPRHLAYLKVSEGCDRLCTFCAIPYMRGKHVTKPIEEVVDEARELAADGVRELNLVAQDMTYYGVDLYGRPRLAELLRELEQVEGIDWIRVLYNYPNYFTDELYEVLASSKDHALSRHAAPAHQRPDAQDDEPPAHPGRDRGDHRTGCGRPSRPGPADDVHRRVPRRDRGRVRGAARVRRGDPVRAARASSPTRSSPTRPRRSCPGTCPTRSRQAPRPGDGRAAGDRLRVQPEPGRPDARRADRRPRAPGAKDLWVGRTYADAPDVDGLTYVPGSDLEPGDLVACEIVGAEGYDLVARPEAASPHRGGEARPEPRKKPSPFTDILDGMPCPEATESGATTAAATPDEAVSAPVLERPEHADAEPAGPRGGRLRADRRLPVRHRPWPSSSLAALTDALDGYFARLLNQGTPLGRQLDPLIDKVIVSGAYIYLASIPATRRVTPGWSRRSWSASS